MGEINSAENYIRDGVVDGNILPLTSNCNTHCVFCSHRFNPPEVRVYRIFPRSPTAIKNIIPFIDPARPIVIGESVTRIIEGEPFTHPDIAEILHLLRSAFPRTPVRLTTNGILLGEEMVQLLSRLGNITVNLSLNCMGEFNRNFLLGDIQAKAAVNSVKLLKKYRIPFHGSIVAMPHLTGWGDLENTINYLSEHEAETVRIFEPGFSRLAPSELQFDHALRGKLESFILHQRKIINIPITFEPPCIGSLEAEVAGVIAGSPAAGAGLQPGDVITAVNGSRVSTRVQAFRKILKAANPDVTVTRGSERSIAFVIRKGRSERSGLVMDYDLDPKLIDDMARVARQRRARKVLLLTSQLAGPVLRQGLARFWKEEADVETLEVENHFFGGSIRAAGLLTVGDMGEGLSEYLAVRTAGKPDLVLLPGLAFDRTGSDLTGTSYTRLEEEYGIALELI
ncbi:MAG: DUF512 domain-containing protein [Desulfotomaculaceae bacterium]|nr:DUF512 domain-containing protein [Desulfotomaculaceae bacterium]